jgi:uncharacterized membrane protein YfcA
VAAAATSWATPPTSSQFVANTVLSLSQRPVRPPAASKASKRGNDARARGHRSSSPMVVGLCTGFASGVRTAGGTR